MFHTYTSSYNAYLIAEDVDDLTTVCQQEVENWKTCLGVGAIKGRGEGEVIQAWMLIA